MSNLKTSVFAMRPARSGRLTSNDRIDVCRGLFAFLVVAAHAVDISWSIHPEARTQYASWLHDLLYYVVAAGVYWVIGFFVISGYCIQLSVMRATVGDHFPLFRYLAARLLRILPLYYAALLFAVVVEWLIAPARPYFWFNGLDVKVLVAQLLIVQNLTQTYGSYAPSWSITNEMFYYVFYGFLVCVAIKRGLRATWLGMSVCVVVALVTEGLYFGLYRSSRVLGPGLLFGLGTLWFLGAMVAENRESLSQSPRARLVSRSWLLVLAAAIAMWYSQRIHLQVVYLVLGAAFTLMLVRFITTEETSLPEEGRRRPSCVVEMLGLASYPTYLFHGPLLMLIGSAILRWELVKDWRLTWVILVLVGFFSGIALGYLAERPMMRWRAACLRRIASPQNPTIGGPVQIGMIGAPQ
jgi:peptidoglycan/LPS O-acetylase OafA/YrhL